MNDQERYVMETLKEWMSKHREGLQRDIKEYEFTLSQIDKIRTGIENLLERKQELLKNTMNVINKSNQETITSMGSTEAIQ